MVLVGPRFNVQAAQVWKSPCGGLSPAKASRRVRARARYLPIAVGQHFRSLGASHSPRRQNLSPKARISGRGLCTRKEHDPMPLDAPRRPHRRARSSPGAFELRKRQTAHTHFTSAKRIPRHLKGCGTHHSTHCEPQCVETLVRAR